MGKADVCPGSISGSSFLHRLQGAHSASQDQAGGDSACPWSQRCSWHCLVQIARALGAIVVGTAGTKDGMDVVTRCGAHHVFNHNHKSYEKKMVDHIGCFDVIIEHLANINLGHDVQMLKPQARVMVVGCRGGVNINPRHLMMPEASICGVALGTTSPAEWAEMGAAIVAGIESGWVNPVINKEYAMEEAQQVHYDIIHSKGAKGKLVLRVAEE